MIEAPIRLAMWSGPRNLSTAMMRRFGARSDTCCVDEPFYAPYLHLTGLDHPLSEDIFARHEIQPECVIENLTKAPTERPIQYQKHLTHHMIPDIPRDWLGQVRHAFLIRHPARVLASYARKMQDVSLQAIGLPQQVELYDQAAQLTGQPPAIIDCDQLLADPARTLHHLCQALSIPYDPSMLCWARGARPEDGAWAPHWYDAVYESTGFGLPSGDLPILTDRLQPVLEQALPLYQSLYAAIRPTP